MRSRTKRVARPNQPKRAPNLLERISALKQAQQSHKGRKRPAGGTPLVLPTTPNSHHEDTPLLNTGITDYKTASENIETVSWAKFSGIEGADSHDENDNARPPSCDGADQPSKEWRSQRNNSNLSWVNEAVNSEASINDVSNIFQDRIEDFLSIVSRLSAPDGASMKEIEELDQIRSLASSTFENRPRRSDPPMGQVGAFQQAPQKISLEDDMEGPDGVVVLTATMSSSSSREVSSFMRALLRETMANNSINGDPSDVASEIDFDGLEEIRSETIYDYRTRNRESQSVGFADPQEAFLDGDRSSYPERASDKSNIEYCDDIKNSYNFLRTGKLGISERVDVFQSTQPEILEEIASYQTIDRRPRGYGEWSLGEDSNDNLVQMRTSYDRRELLCDDEFGEMMKQAAFDQIDEDEDAIHRVLDANHLRNASRVRPRIKEQNPHLLVRNESNSSSWSPESLLDTDDCEAGEIDPLKSSFTTLRNDNAKSGDAPCLQQEHDRRGASIHGFGYWPDVSETKVTNKVPPSSPSTTTRNPMRDYWRTVSAIKTNGSFDSLSIFDSKSFLSSKSSSSSQDGQPLVAHRADIEPKYHNPKSPLAPGVDGSEANANLNDPTQEAATRHGDVKRAQCKHENFAWQTENEHAKAASPTRHMATSLVAEESNLNPSFGQRSDILRRDSVALKNDQLRDSETPKDLESPQDVPAARETPRASNLSAFEYSALAPGEDCFEHRKSENTWKDDSQASNCLLVTDRNARLSKSLELSSQCVEPTEIIDVTELSTGEGRDRDPDAIPNQARQTQNMPVNASNSQPNATRRGEKVQTRLELKSVKQNQRKETNTDQPMASPPIDLSYVSSSSSWEDACVSKSENGSTNDMDQMCSIQTNKSQDCDHSHRGVAMSSKTIDQKVSNALKGHNESSLASMSEDFDWVFPEFNLRSPPVEANAMQEPSKKSVSCANNKTSPSPARCLRPTARNEIAHLEFGSVTEERKIDKARINLADSNAWVYQGTDVDDLTGSGFEAMHRLPAWIQSKNGTSGAVLREPPTAQSGVRAIGTCLERDFVERSGRHGRQGKGSTLMEPEDEIKKSDGFGANSRSSLEMATDVSLQGSAFESNGTRLQRNGFTSAGHPQTFSDDEVLGCDSDQGNRKTSPVPPSIPDRTTDRENCYRTRMSSSRNEAVPRKADQKGASFRGQKKARGESSKSIDAFVKETSAGIKSSSLAATNVKREAANKESSNERIKLKGAMHELEQLRHVNHASSSATSSSRALLGRGFQATSSGAPSSRSTPTRRSSRSRGSSLPNVLPPDHNESHLNDFKGLSVKEGTPDLRTDRLKLHHTSSNSLNASHLVTLPLSTSTSGSGDVARNRIPDRLSEKGQSKGDGRSPKPAEQLNAYIRPHELSKRNAKIQNLSRISNKERRDSTPIPLQETKEANVHPQDIPLLSPEKVSSTWTVSEKTDSSVSRRIRVIENARRVMQPRSKRSLATTTDVLHTPNYQQNGKPRLKAVSVSASLARMDNRRTPVSELQDSKPKQSSAIDREVQTAMSKSPFSDERSNQSDDEGRGTQRRMPDQKNIIHIGEEKTPSREELRARSYPFVNRVPSIEKILSQSPHSTVLDTEPPIDEDVTRRKGALSPERISVNISSRHSLIPNIRNAPTEDPPGAASDFRFSPDGTQGCRKTQKPAEVLEHRKHQEVEISQSRSPLMFKHQSRSSILSMSSPHCSLIDGSDDDEGDEANSNGAVKSPDFSERTSVIDGGMMTPEGNIPLQYQGEIPKPVAEKLLYLMGPLMSGDSTDDGDQETSATEEDTVKADAEKKSQFCSLLCGDFDFRNSIKGLSCFS